MVPPDIAAAVKVQVRAGVTAAVALDTRVYTAVRQVQNSR